jgi:hypothetical protein
VDEPEMYVEFEDEGIPQQAIVLENACGKPKWRNFSTTEKKKWLKEAIKSMFTIDGTKESANSRNIQWYKWHAIYNTNAKIFWVCRCCL